MAKWIVKYHLDLEKEIRCLPRPYIQRILKAIENLSNNPNPPGSKKIQGHDLWRVQVGVYRIIYQIDEENQIVNTYRIGHRRGVYRNL